QQEQERAALRLHNPFTLRVGQVFTGFGVGCGIGIGVGRAFNLRSIPVVGSVAGEAIGSFSSFKPHVDSLGKKLGIKNIQAGAGCGVGLGHGFGIGITLKPGTVLQLKQLMEQAFSSVNERVKSFAGSSGSEEGISAGSSGSQEGISNEERTLTVTDGKILPEIFSSKGLASMHSLESSMQNMSRAADKGQSSQEPTHGEVNRLQTENTILLTLLRHQAEIESLRKENAALKQTLVEAEGSSSRPKVLCDEAEHLTQDKRS
ncbi:hypothetical protein GOP47_0004989, partial [Adiantum capillus-veneris]